MFMIFSSIGYIVEVIDIYIEKHVFSFSRGFLIGPYIPIYGVGAMIMYLLLSRYNDDVIVLFILSMVLCTIIEYVTSYVMEKMFNLRWWDYSDEKFNINGRVYLLNSIFFGLLGIIVCSFLGPFLSNFISNWNDIILYIVAMVLLVVFVCDIIISNIIVTKLKQRAYEYSRKDATAEIRQQVREEIIQHITLYSRIFRAFPTMFSKDNRIVEIKKLISKVKMDLKNLKKKMRMLLL